MADPWDGGTRTGPARRAEVAFDPLLVLAVCSSGPHGFNPGDSIQITNVTGPADLAYNQMGPFVTKPGLEAAIEDALLFALL